jgi:chromosomal replication initiation ATPase DnaA
MKDKLLLCLNKLPTISELKLIVADYFTMSVETLEKKTRKREIVKARQTAHFFAH